MTTFKVGDRVKLVNNSYYSVNEVGFIGHVVQVDRDTHRKCPIYLVAAKPGDIIPDGNWSVETDLVAYPEMVYEDDLMYNDLDELAEGLVERFSEVPKEDWGSDPTLQRIKTLWSAYLDAKKEAKEHGWKGVGCITYAENKLQQMQRFDEYGNYGENNPPVGDAE